MMEKEEIILKNIKPIKWGNYWIIQLKYTNEWMDGIVTSNVEDIVEILGIRKHNYIQTLLKEFDGNLSVLFNIYFDTEEKCQKAIDWLYSQVVLNKLTKED